jgi:cytochrome c2
MKWYIGLGTFSIIVVTGALAFLAVGETARMEDFTEAFHSRRIESGAALFENLCRSCHGPQGEGIQGVAPALQVADLFNGSRLEAIGYGGTVEDYVRSAVAAGRPVPSAGTSYPQRMPTWSQKFGGPLRDDQIESLVAFVMNWEEPALAGAVAVEPLPAGEFVGSDMSIDLPEGDPENGQSLAEGALGCSGCHLLSPTGPAWAAVGDVPGVGARAEERMIQSDYTGEAENATEYLVESVIQTNAFVVSDFQANIMPGDYGSRITVQDLADLVAYMESFR